MRRARRKERAARPLLPLPDPQLIEAVVVDPEVVAELVQHRRPDLRAERRLVGEVLFERLLVDVDDVRRNEVVAAVALRQGDAAVEAVHRLVAPETGGGEVVARGPALHDDVDLAQLLPERRGDVAQRRPDDADETRALHGLRRGRPARASGIPHPRSPGAAPRARSVAARRAAPRTPVPPARSR